MTKNKDRGLMKWTAMMLPEHVGLLDEWYNSAEQIRETLPDSQIYCEWEETLQQALVHSTPIFVVTKPHRTKLNGVIRKWDAITGTLVLMNGNSRMNVNIASIISVNSVES
ncbi:MAG: YolD-like family protein [Bacilli bacterium]